ncbi:disintegrin and metalloproteinase domain-containing protein 12-like [Hypanus sabinus]|uniref:disintegrin and metalloproteinase domain-containing protein 12-like n=1 Tax=Hypanus sabinus TaxID=79690 RepID=UPI0028C5108A|nr:disintegrin and metalloproteinase domain-containing protein 12-like [Hypanus sabinus]
MPRYLGLMGFAICGRLLTALWTGSPEPMPQSSAEGPSGHGRLAEKLLGEDPQYRVISPFIISGGQMRNMDHLQQNNYTDDVEIWMEIEEQHLTLDLRRNHFLIPESLHVSYYDANGTLVTEQSSSLTHCFYEGTVRGFLGSQVAANICSGLSGLVILSNESYVIEHVEREGHGYHLLFGPKHLKLKEMKSSSKHLFSEHTQHPLRLKRSLGPEMKYLELVLVADKVEYQSAFSSKRKVLNRLANAANYVDLFYRPLYLRIALIGVEVWTTDQIVVDDNASATMKRFLTWRKRSLLPRLHNDNAQLITFRISS